MSFKRDGFLFLQSFHQCCIQLVVLLVKATEGDIDISVVSAKEFLHSMDGDFGRIVFWKSIYTCADVREGDGTDLMLNGQFQTVAVR